MTSTKTRPAATPEVDHQQTLALAKERLTALRERVGSGDQSVTAGELADAEDAVHLAELRIEAAAELAAREADTLRLARIEEIRASLADGFLHAQAAAIVPAFDRAANACAELYRLKVAYERDLTGAIADLYRVRPLPRGIVVSGHGLDRTAVVDGRRWSPSIRYNVALVAEAAAAGIDRAGLGRQADSDGRSALAQVAGSASRIERFRRYAVGDETRDQGDD